SRLRFRAAVNRHDHGTLSRELRRRTNDEAADRTAVETVPFDSFGVAKLRGIETRDSRLRPARDAILTHVDSIDVAWALRAVDRHREIARIVVPHETAHAAHGQRRARQRF